ncbi:hypothetical protein [Mycoplasma sp. OR1901]|uniref:hypothetical protein n=1 Tax=Mycoplasma sp. OR1901 TaxID=2742195 RepID=UPI0015834BAB|nr:hypothetical protein [Mycoplasma sp. OR1901]QKT05358.1 hypothetical protein HTZ87_01425 [Mycoplasma sp. OR1901]
MKFKKIKFLIGGVVLTTLAPLSTVSCFYDNDNSVKFSDKFVKNNLFNNVAFNPVEGYFKNNEAYKQREFINNIIKTKKLTYTFSNVDVALPNIVSVDNEHLRKKFNDFYLIENNNLKINDQKITEYKNKFDTFTEKRNQEKEKYENNSYILERIEYVDELSKINFTSLDVLKNTIDELKNNIKEYKALEPNKEHKTLSRIKKYIFNDKRDTGILVEKERIIQKDLIALDNFSYFDLSNTKNVVTNADVKWIVEHFVKNTPFATYDVLSKESSKEDEQANEYLKIGQPILTYDSSSYKFNVSISPQIVENAIPRNVFEKIAGKNLDLFLKSKQAKGSMLFKELYKNFITNYSNFKVESLDSVSNGISLGFGPTHLLQSIDRINKERSDEYQIFTYEIEKYNDKKQIELTTEQNEEFLKNPVEFVKSHLYLIIYKKRDDSLNSLHNTINNYTSLNNTLNEQIKNNPKTASLNKRLIKENDAKIVQAQIKLKKFEEDLIEVERIQTSAAYLNNSLPEKDQQFLDKFKLDHKEDIDFIVNFVAKETEIATSTQFSLVEIFAKMMFLLDNRSQIILGTNQGKKTYWLELQESNGEWKAYDVYSLFKATKDSASAENINFDDYQLKDKIDNGEFIIDPAFIKIANVKK